MTPEERELLNRSLVLAEENNKILLRLQRNIKWQTVWGVFKVLVVVVPLVFGYLFLEPYLDPLLNNYKNMQGLLDTSKAFSVSR